MSGKAMHGKKLGRTLWRRIQDAWRGRKSAAERARGRRNRLRFEALEERRVMTVNHEVDAHIHPYLKIFIDGSPVTIPANIGLGTAEYSPHTHDTAGKLHVGEGLPAGIDRQNRYVTLKDFFDVWRTTNVGDPTRNNPNAFFDSTHLLDKVADANHSVYMTVNGVPNTEYQNYIPEDGDEIILSYASNDGKPTLAAIPDATVLGGSPLLVPLDGFDPTNQQVTYTVTSSNPLVTPTLMTNEPSWRVKVEGYGDMVFQLFTNEAPRTANRVSTLANQGFYNGLTFHRILNNFVIQGGDPAGNGTGGSDLGNFDDTFNVDLQHNRTGILSYAKSSDDTNNSQFFITEGPQRHLDFNHSIFGLLIEGESVRDAVSNVAANSSGVPTNTVFIDKATIYNDLQNAVLKLKAAEGASGSADITVTARDTDGHTAVRTFRVTVTPDTVNGGPFLNDIPAIRTTVNTAAQFQLTSQDVEGNAVTYSASKGDSLSSTVSVNATTGQVTATPPTDFVGVMKVRASVAAATGQPNDTGDKSDVQLVNVTVAPSAPTAVDLTSVSDTGLSNTDNITNLTAPTILITGVTNGSTVKLYNGTTLLGQTTSTGTSASITLSNLSAGSYLLTATQTVSDIESDRSASLNMVLDTTAPQITSTPPTTGKVNQTLVYDAGSPEEGIANFRYDLVSAPSGAVIDAATGVLSWMPSSTQAGLQQFGVRFTDAAGNFATQNLSINVADADQVRLRVAVTDSSGNALSGVTVGQDFQLRGFAKDLRSAGTAAGVYAAYWDVTYATDMATVTGAIDHGSTYSVSAAGSTATAGLIDEVGGAAASLAPLGSSEQLVFIVPMRASKAGTLTFSGNPSDLAPTHEVLLYNQDPAVLSSRQSFPELAVTVASTIGANADTFNVDEDSSQGTLDVLANDVPPSGGTLTVTAVGTPNRGGTVTVGTGGANVRYTPAANFNGEETFTYSVTSGSETTTATVTVQVHPINDAPTAVADSFTVAGNSANDILDVLLNDLITPDTGETLRVTAVGTPSHGTLTIGPNGTHVVYSPTNGYVGSDSFTYTVSDPANATSTATATVTVRNPNTAPAAVDDQFTVAEDSSQFTLNPLANDSAGANNSGATLTITAVGTPDKSGLVTIASDGKSLRYSPASNFVGTEKFTYTMSDGVETATGTATVTVTNVNDPPNAADDTTTTYKNAGAQTINVLSNDVSTPDPTETFTIQAVTQGAHGAVAIASDGKSVTYSPATDYTGADTFTYTINDGNGGTDTATVNVTVADFIPSSLAGNVYFDVNGDGTRQASELPIVGVTITLTGTPTGGQAITQTTKTDATGAYQFTGLAPGSYVIAQTQPAFLPDGPDKVGSQGGTLANDQITIALAQNTQGTGNDFGEKRAAKMVTIHNFLARNTRQYLLSAVDSAGSQLWTSPGPGWTNYAAIQTSLSTSLSELHIQVDSQPSAPQAATLPTTDSRTRLLESQGANSLYRVRSAPTDLTFLAVTVSPTNSSSGDPNANSGSGGEGEGDAAASRSVLLQAISEEASAVVSDDVLADLASQWAASGRNSADATVQSTSSPTGGINRFLARRSLTSASFAQGVDQLLGGI